MNIFLRTENKSDILTEPDSTGKDLNLSHETLAHLDKHDFKKSLVIV